MDKKIYTESEINNWPFQAVDLMATYEELYKVPEQEQVTVYFGDFGSHFFKSPSQGATPEHISDVFNKSLNAIGMTKDEFFAQKDSFIYRSEIKKLMEGKMKESLQDKIDAAKNVSEHESKSSVMNNHSNQEFGEER